MTKTFQACEICAAQDWTDVYAGPVRDGAFGSLTPETVVARCGQCGAERLRDDAARDDTIYTDSAYRELLKEPTGAAGYMAEHDVLQMRNLAELWPESLRGKTHADIGCAAGSFLDHISGLADALIAVEPCLDYHNSLKARGYHVFSALEQACSAWSGKVDQITSFSVIEHVGDPRGFLAGMAELLRPDGRIVISTPNRDDVMMEMLPDDYPAFFYRSVHRWYFDKASLLACAEQAGLRVVEIRCRHRFGLSNAMHWLRDRAPRRDAAILDLPARRLDDLWRAELEADGRGDYLYAVLAHPG
jgi:SAM-dependent methyltransferase